MEVEKNNQNKVKEHIDNVIERTFDILLNVYNGCSYNNNSVNGREINSHIIFPKYRSGKLRISEQELRLVFVEQLIAVIRDNNLDIFYSIETPTKDKYLFSGLIPIISEKGKSANFDLVIHDNKYNRIALIEFKAKNSDKKKHQKDFVKLKNEKEATNGSILKYFIEIVESSNDATFRSLWSKTSNFEDEGIIFRCLCLKNGEITEKIKEVKNK